MQRWAIEFRSGTYLQHETARNGGPARGARRFLSRQEAEELISQHDWIALNGGMAVHLKDG